MACKMCDERGKTWRGGDPKCAFDKGEFSTDNWNCATVNAIRGICESSGVAKCTDDEWFCALDVSGIFNGITPAYTLWVKWYKRRGRTDQMIILGDGGANYINEKEALDVIKYFDTV